jgi:hypothetical protein
VGTFVDVTVYSQYNNIIKKIRCDLLFSSLKFFSEIKSKFHSMTYKILFSFFSFLFPLLFLEFLRFELRTSHLLGRCYTIWVMFPVSQILYDVGPT